MKDLSYLAAPSQNVILNFDNDKKGNIFCLSGINTKHITGTRENMEFDTRSLGNSLIVIHNPKEFINRVISKLNEKGFKNVQYKSVAYYKKDYSGPVGFFRKNEKFKLQNEFRFFVPNEKNESLKFCIGSLKDIATIENNSPIKITFTDNKEQIIKI